MRIESIEVQNFRKLKSIRVDFANETTLFVGPNNSGKTSAMTALRYFLVEPKQFSRNDFTLSNWKALDSIGKAWEAEGTESAELETSAWEKIFPTLDVWIGVGENEVHHVSHLIPTLDWEPGLLGVRLRFEPKQLEQLRRDYVTARQNAKETLTKANESRIGSEFTLGLWPSNLIDFLEKRLKTYFQVKSYLLDPTGYTTPSQGVASPQALPTESLPIDGNPFQGLIAIREIDAQRGFSDSSRSDRRDSYSSTDPAESRAKKKLSDQLIGYYRDHVDPSESPEPEDVEALHSIKIAKEAFDAKLEEGFKKPLSELEELGYPGVTDPKLTISTEIRPIDGMKHPSALQYDVITHPEENGSAHQNYRLPEQFTGLGYQNLISIVFRLIGFREDWLKSGKAGRQGEEHSPPPLLLVLVEEPEAHLHVQVQQVFLRKAFQILRNHPELKDKPELTTQLVISTHSSHIAHESEFAWLRYFRRKPAAEAGDVPTTSVVNLSEVFGSADTTQRFVERYIRSTHCDLFFADAAILVEGAAEGILLPHFIRENFPRLYHAYLTILQIGGSHAHRLRGLIDHLGLTTLVITDLDSQASTGKKAQPVKKGVEQVTGNSTLVKWLPGKKDVDVLLLLPANEKELKVDQFHSVRAAYQIGVPISLDGSTTPKEAFPYTFEDSLVLENLEIFRATEEKGVFSKIKEAIEGAKAPDELTESLFVIVQNAKKAEFALDLLHFKEPDSLKVPNYIKEGLEWLETTLQAKQEKVVLVAPTVECGEEVSS